jgi:hypothetical protein
MDAPAPPDYLGNQSGHSVPPCQRGAAVSLGLLLSFWVSVFLLGAFASRLLSPCNREKPRENAAVFPHSFGFCALSTTLEFEPPIFSFAKGYMKRSGV